ncbi:TPA: glycosyltransferase [Clostridium perfringens]|nr:glycosyltransferase [Clostridium perfringens]
MKNILLVAFACKPNEGSESGVGWNYINLIREIRPNDNIYVLTWADENQPQLLKEFEDKFNFIFIDLDNKYKRLFSKDFTKGLKMMEIFYMLWQKKAMKHIEKVYGKNFFDIVHHITFVSATLPSKFIDLNSKFIWGPISSNDLYPYKVGINKCEYLKLLIKDTAKKIVRSFSITFKKNLKKSDAIIINTVDIKDKLKINENKKVYNISSIGIEKKSLKHSKEKNSKNFTIAFIGEFMSIKNVDLALESFALYNKTKNGKSKFYLIGDGENKDLVKKIINKKNINNDVIQYGWISRNSVLEKLKNEIDVLLFPTCEKAGMVILEAMNAGVPIVGLNYGGPKVLSQGNGSELVSIINREQIIQDLSKALDIIFNNYNYYSKEAYKQSEKFYWDYIKEKLKNVYQEVLDE